MISKISKKDREDWENFLSTNENLPNKDYNTKKKKTKKIYKFDLHGHSLDEANERVKNLIFTAYNNEISKIVVVTGKGIHSKNKKNPYISEDLGILKNSVPEFIKSNEELMGKINQIKEATAEDGGSGAFYIYIKKKTIK